MKSLPYFRWYPADAETDSAYASLNDAELGFYHRCLNRAWLNGGIPANLDELATTFRRSRKALDRVWPKVSIKWIPSQDDATILVNPRQEKEREYARTKSERNTDAVRTRYERSANVVQHARARADSVCVSDSVSDSVLEKPPEKKEPSTRAREPSVHFLEFWAMYPRKTGVDAAASAWNSCVTVENENEVMACLSRYLASDEVARGAVQNAGPSRDKIGWIFSCSADKWACEWPRAKPIKTKQELSAEAWDRA